MTTIRMTPPTLQATAMMIVVVDDDDDDPDGLPAVPALPDGLGGDGGGGLFLCFSGNTVTGVNGVVVVDVIGVEDVGSAAGDACLSGRITTGGLGRVVGGGGLNTGVIGGEIATGATGGGFET